jgi:hypothetical protein
MFWFPPIASTVMFALSSGGFAGAPRALTVCWAIALIFQGLAGLFSPVWLVGLVLQVGVALYLAVKLTVLS